MKRNRTHRVDLRAEALEVRLLLTGFTAFNGLFSGDTHENTTFYSDMGSADRSGPLVDIETGAVTDVLLTTEESGVTFDSNGTQPAAGTDAHDIFAGFVDFSVGSSRSLEISGDNFYQYTFSNLQAGATYEFAGAGVRGNPSYTNRWTLVEIIGADSFTPAHSSGTGVVTAGLQPNQVAIWFGDNASQGYVAQWTDVAPGADGEFRVRSTQYSGTVPTSIHASGTADGSKTYGVAGIRLIENIPAGPPVIETVPASDVRAFEATVGGTITTTGGELPNVKLYYGLSDGGTDPGAWEDLVDLGFQARDFETVIGGLSQNTTYYFRAFAQNSLGSDWANSSVRFTTQVAAPPSLTTAPATNVGAFSATLNGEVVSTGNDAPLVTIYYGASDGGTNANAWDHSVSLGLQEGNFAAFAAELEELTRYYFTAFAQNSLGSDWATPSRSFTTTDTPPLFISEFMADNANVLLTRTRETIGDSFLGDNQSPDWIELSNPTASSVDIGGFHLTDDLADPMKWQFPVGTIIPSGGYLIVFASGNDIAEPNLDEQRYLHTNFQLTSGGGEDLALTDDNGTVVFAYEKLPVQSENVAYGVNAAQEERFYAQPTPGENNANDVPKAPRFSVKSQTFQNQITVTLTSAIPTDTIRYTLNETIPTSSSTTYTGPITLSNTTQVRAISVGANGKTSVVTSQTFLSLNSNVTNDTSNLPIVIVETFGDGVGQDAFFAVLEPGDDGRTRLTDAFTTMTRGSIHVRGSSSSGFSKKQYRVEFWDETNEDQKQPLLGMPSEADWIFYGPSQYDRVLISNPLMFDLSNQIGRYAVRTRWVEMYLNNGGTVSDSDYVGVYAIMEVVEEGDDRVDVGGLISSGAGGLPVDGGFIWKVDRGSAYVDPDNPTSAQRAYIDAWFNNLSNAAAAANFDDPINGYAKYIDVQSFIDHHLLNVLSNNADALRLSTYYNKPAGGRINAGPIWDFDRSLESTDGRDNNPRSWFGGGGTDFFSYAGEGGWWDNLFDDPNFVRQYIDRWFELRENELSLGNLFATIDAHAAQISEAAARDYSRWANSRFGNFAGEINHLKNYLQDRVEWMDDQWLTSPVFDRSSGQVPPGTQVTLTSSEGGTILYTLDGTDPAGSISTDGAAQIEVLAAGGAASFHVPSNATLIEACRAIGIALPNPPNCFMNPDYVEGTHGESWIAGDLPVGYDYPGVNTDVQDEIQNVNTSMYIRVPFEVTAEEKEGAAGAFLNMNWEDGFVAYMWYDTLNIPVELARGNAGTDGPLFPIVPLEYDAAPPGSRPDSSAVLVDAVRIPSAYISTTNTNYLVIQLLNAGLTSSDLLFDVSITLDKSVTTLPPDAIEYTGPITINDFTQITARVFVDNHGPNQGYVAAGDDWSPPVTAQYFLDPPAASGNIVISEVNYNPTGPTPSEIAAGFDNDDDFEFIELWNVSDGRIELTGASLGRVDIDDHSEGVEFEFEGSGATQLGPGERVLIVEDRAGFEARYGTGLPVAGEWSGGLSNNRETLTLLGRSGDVIQQFQYDDSGDWPDRADGNGSSLEIVDFQQDSADGNNWRSSIDYGGSPGLPPRPRSAVVINELLANSETLLDTIELFNTGGMAVDISGWYLTDSNKDYFKFEIPAGTILGAGQYVVFDENDFNAGGGQEPTDFSLSSFGDDVSLLGADDGKFFFVDRIDFGSTLTDVSLGRLANGVGRTVPLSTPSFGAENLQHRLGELVISEVHYNPTGSDAGLEFVEIYNRTGGTIDLGDWRLNRGVDFGLPSLDLPASGVVVAVDFDPILQPATAASFRSHYGIDTSAVLVGPWQSTDVLDDGGETVALERVNDELEPGATEFEYILIDEVRYDDEVPWSTAADGMGQSLHRATAEAYGNDPHQWFANNPTPGTVPFIDSTDGDVDGDGDTDGDDVQLVCGGIRDSSANIALDLTGDGEIDLDDLDAVLRLVGSLRGDADFDGDVDAADLNALGLNWQALAGADWSDGDFDCDGRVRSVDLNLLGLNWQSTAASAASAARVPRAALAVNLVDVAVTELVTQAANKDDPIQQAGWPVSKGVVAKPRFEQPRRWESIKRRDPVGSHEQISRHRFSDLLDEILSQIDTRFE